MMAAKLPCGLQTTRKILDKHNYSCKLLDSVPYVDVRDALYEFNVYADNPDVSSSSRQLRRSHSQSAVSSQQKLSQKDVNEEDAPRRSHRTPVPSSKALSMSEVMSAKRKPSKIRKTKLRRRVFTQTVKRKTKGKRGRKPKKQVSRVVESDDEEEILVLVEDDDKMEDDEDEQQASTSAEPAQSVQVEEATAGVSTEDGEEMKMKRTSRLSAKSESPILLTPMKRTSNRISAKSKHLDDGRKVLRSQKSKQNTAATLVIESDDELNQGEEPDVSKDSEESPKRASLRVSPRTKSADHSKRKLRLISEPSAKKTKKIDMQSDDHGEIEKSISADGEGEGGAEEEKTLTKRSSSRVPAKAKGAGLQEHKSSPKAKTAKRKRIIVQSEDESENTNDHYEETTGNSDADIPQDKAITSEGSQAKHPSKQQTKKMQRIVQFVELSESASSSTVEDPHDNHEPANREQEDEEAERDAPGSEHANDEEEIYDDLEGQGEQERDDFDVPESGDFSPASPAAVEDSQECVDVDEPPGAEEEVTTNGYAKSDNGNVRNAMVASPSSSAGGDEVARERAALTSDELFSMLCEEGASGSKGEKVAEEADAARTRERSPDAESAEGKLPDSHTSNADLKCDPPISQDKENRNELNVAKSQWKCKDKRKSLFKIRFKKFVTHVCSHCKQAFEKNADLQAHVMRHYETRQVRVHLFNATLPKTFATSETNMDRYLRPRRSPSSEPDAEEVKQLLAKYVNDLNSFDSVIDGDCSATSATRDADEEVEGNASRNILVLSNICITPDGKCLDTNTSADRSSSNEEDADSVEVEIGSLDGSTNADGCRSQLTERIEDNSPDIFISLESESLADSSEDKFILNADTDNDPKRKSRSEDTEEQLSGDMTEVSAKDALDSNCNENPSNANEEDASKQNAASSGNRSEEESNPDMDEDVGGNNETIVQSESSQRNSEDNSGQQVDLQGKSNELAEDGKSSEQLRNEGNAEIIEISDGSEDILELVQPTIRNSPEGDDSSQLSSNENITITENTNEDDNGGLEGHVADEESRNTQIDNEEEFHSATEEISSPENTMLFKRKRSEYAEETFEPKRIRIEGDVGDNADLNLSNDERLTPNSVTSDVMANEYLMKLTNLDKQVESLVMKDRTSGGGTEL